MMMMIDSSNTYLSIRNVDAQVDITEGARANFPHQSITSANNEL